MINELALTGPAAAVLLGLEGFDGTTWAEVFCAPITVEPRRDLIRTRRWTSPIVVGNRLVAAPHLVLRHLGCLADEEYLRNEAVDGLSVRRRVALAAEHARRENQVRLAQLEFCGGAQLGGYRLREYLQDCGDEPPTESYAETVFWLEARSAGLNLFRQVEVRLPNGKWIRVDFAIAINQGRNRARRPSAVDPLDHLLVEVNGWEHHHDRTAFERDHHRNLALQRLGFTVLHISAAQVMFQPDAVLDYVMAAMRRGRIKERLERVNTPRKEAV
jgi:hypothetical protein